MRPYAALSVVGALLPAIAQDRVAAQPIASETLTAIDLPPASSYAPLTPAEKLTFAIQRTFDRGSLARTVFASGVDTLTDTPEPWPSGMEGFGMRLGSKLGHRMAKHAIMAGVQTVMHDDPRRIPTTATGFWPRTRQAFLNTYRIRHDDGVRTHFNYSRLAGAYGAGFVSRTWHPDGYRSAGDSLVNGTFTLGVDGAMSVIWEFWPDMKKKMLRRR